MDEQQKVSEEKIIQLEAPQTKKETTSLIKTIAAVAAAFGILSFIVGFGVGTLYLFASSTQNPKTASPSATIEGGKVFVDEENLYAISYPKGWEPENHNPNDYEGVKISSEKGYVDLWLLVDQPFLLGSNHQKAIKSEEEVGIQVDGNTGSGIQYNYKAGNFFTVLVLPDSANTPQVTFWLEADDEKTKEETRQIVESFIFLDK